MANATLPIFSDTVDQRWFIEPITGAKPPESYLARFPEEVYNTSLDSHLVRLIYTLIGPAGIGWLKKNLLDARLALEDQGLELFDLEKFYGDPLGFGRILEELYDDDPTGLLTRADWDRIKMRDEGYRSRAITYFQGARLGNSPQGLTLVAESGIGFKVDIVENYRHLYDVHSDDRLGLQYFGKTDNLEEFIVRPKRDVSRSEVQTITVEGDPVGGGYILEFNGRFTSQYQYQPTTTITSNTTLPTATIAVVSTAGFPDSGSVTIADQTVNYTSITGNTLEGCSGGTGTFQLGTLVIAPVQDYTSIPWNANPAQVQAALQSLFGIGRDGVLVTGGPTPGPYNVIFGGPLSNQNVPLLKAYGSFIGGTDPTVTIDTARGGLDASKEIISIPPDLRHNLQTALDFIRPVPTIPTVYDHQGTRSRQAWASAIADSEYTEVLRFVTGANGVQWPALDKSHWIEKGVEKEAPHLAKDLQQHYSNVHNVVGIQAYTDEAISASPTGYEASSTVSAQFRSELNGFFGLDIQRAMPFFRINSSRSYTADLALAFDFIAVTGQAADKTLLIDRIYPEDYFNLRGVKPLKTLTPTRFWASRERELGTDYLEVDLGSVQAVNFVVFETTLKPVDIEVAYDTLDQVPRRHFVPVSPYPFSTFESSLHFESRANPWHRVEHHCVDAAGQTIFTRFIRIGISRRDQSSPLEPGFLFDRDKNVQRPWSVDIRNLMVARNVSE